jgi:Iap family predicted aminopeptidase
VKNAKIWKQDFSVISISIDSVGLEVEDKSIHIYGLTYSPSTSAEGITAEIALGPEGAAGCDASSYRDLDVKDKIVLVKRSRCPNGDTLAGRVMPAAAAGACAVIIYHDLSTNVTAGSLGASDTKKYVPAGLINLDDGLKLKKRIEAGHKVEAHFQQTQNIKNRVTQNVIAETTGGDPRNVIMVGHPSRLH